MDDNMMTPGVMDEKQAEAHKIGLLEILHNATLGVMGGQVTGIVLITSGDQGTGAATGFMSNPQQLLGAVHLAALQIGQEILEINKARAAQEQAAQDAVSAGGTE